jgi:hypothetical protein
MNPSAVLGRRRPRLVRRLAGPALPTILLLAIGQSANAQGGGITDLPFVSGTIGVNCGWHLSCHPDRPLDGKGIDLDMDMNTLVVAAGNGTVQESGPNATWGNQVVVDHGGGSASRYAHLNYYFPTEGARACRYVALGYSGNTGRWTTGPHLHFQDDGGLFTPVFGIRDGAGGGSQYQEQDFDPHMSPNPNTAQVSHACGPRGGMDCRHDTRALTVDEVQSRTQPALCGTGCEFDEFDLDPWGGGDWRHVVGGFGYGYKANAKHFLGPLYDDGPYRHSAFWMPRLAVTDLAWDIYAFIPQSSAPLAKAVRYRVQYCQAYRPDPPRRCLAWASQETVLDQQQLSTQPSTRNGWVELFTDIPTFWTDEHSTRPIVVRMYDDRVGACKANGPGQPDPCAGQSIAADALMFLPASCY